MLVKDPENDAEAMKSRIHKMDGELQRGYENRAVISRITALYNRLFSTDFF